LESVSPKDLSGSLVDAVDALDLIILSAIAEAETLEEELSQATLEARLHTLWQSSLAAVTEVEEQRLGQLLLLRGRAVTAEYPDPGERKRLYSVGLPPKRGRDFVATAELLAQYFRTGTDYGALSAKQRGEWLEGLIEHLKDDASLGFRDPGELKGASEVQQDWRKHLAWWLGLTNDFPVGAELYQVFRFVNDQFDYRTGVAVGAALSLVWNQVGGTEDAADPDVWHQTTGLPWAAYWVRELLRWGTPHPVCAHAYSRGIVVTREEAHELRDSFLGWLAQSGHTAPDDRLHPTRIQQWEREVFPEFGHASVDRGPRVTSMEIDEHFRGASGEFIVWPIVNETGTTWFEPGGYRVGHSASIPELADATSRQRCFFRAVPSEGLIKWTME